MNGLLSEMRSENIDNFTTASKGSRCSVTQKSITFPCSTFLDSTVVIHSVQILLHVEYLHDSNGPSRTQSFQFVPRVPSFKLIPKCIDSPLGILCHSNN